MFGLLLFGPDVLDDVGAPPPVDPDDCCCCCADGCVSVNGVGFL